MTGKSPRKPAAQPTPPVADPLADLREDQRYPQGEQNGTQEAPVDLQKVQGPLDESDPLLRLLNEAVERAQAEDADAQAIVEDLAATLRPTLITEPDNALEAVVARWHADTTAEGFLHRGGRCGCLYLARMALEG